LRYIPLRGLKSDVGALNFLGGWLGERRRVGQEGRLGGVSKSLALKGQNLKVGSGRDGERW